MFNSGLFEQRNDGKQISLHAYDLPVALSPHVCMCLTCVCVGNYRSHQVSHELVEKTHVNSGSVREASEHICVLDL